MSSPPESLPEISATPVRKWKPRWWWPLASGVTYGVAIRLVFSGEPHGPYTAMMGSFTLLVPMFVGAVTVMLAERIARRSWAYYFWAAAAANALFVVGTLALSIEGLVCCILAVPLFSLLGGIGGLLTGALCVAKRNGRANPFTDLPFFHSLSVVWNRTCRCLTRSKVRSSPAQWLPRPPPCGSIFYLQNPFGRTK